MDNGNPLIAAAPSLADYLNEESASYFKAVKVISMMQTLLMKSMQILFVGLIIIIIRRLK